MLKADSDLRVTLFSHLVQTKYNLHDFLITMLQE